MSVMFQTPQNLALDAQIDVLSIIDPMGNPSLVIEKNTGFSIDLRWTLSGSAVPFLGGTWTVRAMVESIGAGFEGQIGPTIVLAVNGSNSYSATVVVPPGPFSTPAADTVYKLVMLVSHTGVSGAKTIMAGFGDGPYFEVEA